MLSHREKQLLDSNSAGPALSHPLWSTKMKNTSKALACAFALAIFPNLASIASQTSGTNKTIAVPDTTFSDAQSLSIFTIYRTGGYDPKQLTLRSGNGVVDFRLTPAYIADAPPQGSTSTQLVADGSTGQTKVIPFKTPFKAKFKVSVVAVPFTGGSAAVFELHDTDAVFARWGDPAKSAIRLEGGTGVYTFYANGQPIWTAPCVLKQHDKFELSGILQPNTDTSGVGRLTLTYNGVVVAQHQGPNTNGMTPQYDGIPGFPPPEQPPAPHPLTSGPHVRLGIGKLPNLTTPIQSSPLEVYMDDVEAFYSPTK